MILNINKRYYNLYCDILKCKLYLCRHQAQSFFPNRDKSRLSLKASKGTRIKLIDSRLTFTSKSFYLSFFSFCPPSDQSHFSSMLDPENVSEMKTN